MRLDPVVGGLVLGYALDRAVGDPQRWHPVAGFGSLAASLEGITYSPSRSRGVVHELVLVGGVVTVSSALSRMPRSTQLPLVAAATWTVLGGRSLEREAMAVHDLVVAGDLPAARLRVRSLVGRDPSTLDADGLARACVESLAENGSDAVVAPLLWGGALGIPGLLGYRAINTLDAMVGHRSERYAAFGWCAARVDDVANWVPARVATLATVALSGRRGPQVWRIVRRDAPAHPSPNGGPVEAAAAGHLGITIGGANSYGGEVEDRGRLGDGPAATIADVPRATRLTRQVSLASLGVAVTLRLAARAAARRICRGTAR